MFWGFTLTHADNSQNGSQVDGKAERRLFEVLFREIQAARGWNRGKNSWIVLRNINVAKIHPAIQDRVLVSYKWQCPIDSVTKVVKEIILDWWVNIFGKCKG